MTYAGESRASAGAYIVPPPRTPVGPSMLKTEQRKALQPKNTGNSLDYWSKSEDEKSGITCYYSRQALPRQNNYKQPRPAYTGVPSTSAAPPRFPPFPQSTPQPESIMSPPAGIYRNVPAMPRAKLAKEEKKVVWGGRKEQLEETSAITPLNGHASTEKKRSTARRKPRWARCMQTLFCCVTPPREIEKIQSNQRTSSQNGTTPASSLAAANGHSATPTSAANGPPIQLITQVHRDGTVTGLPPAGNGVGLVNGSGDGPQPVLAAGYDKIESGAINEKPLLPPLLAQDANKKCLVIDLDETLVHSSFKPVKNPDFVIPVEIDGVEHQVYVLKRPYVDEFLAAVGEHFECILFTASLAKYADPVADLLDKKKVFRSRLFREACVFHKGNYVKDLSRLGRNLNQTLIIDNSPASYAFHPENAVPVTTWFDDPSDTELIDMLPHLENLNTFQSIYDLYQPEEGPNSELLMH